MTSTESAAPEVHGRWSNKWVPLAVIAGLFALVAGAALVAAHFLDGPDSSRLGVTPRADIVIDVRPGPGLDDPGRRQLPGPEDEILDDTFEHVADASSANGVTELLRWQQLTRAVVMACTGYSDEQGSSANCAPADRLDEAPSLAWSRLPDRRGDLTISVFVSNAPANAAWVVAETSERIRIAAPVVDGMSFLDWNAAAGKADRALLLDDRFREIWSGIPHVSSDVGPFGPQGPDGP